MRYILIYFTLFIIINGCSNNNGNNGDNVIEFGVIYANNISTIEKQQKFIDELYYYVSNVKDDNNFKVDTQKLTELMDSAMFVNRNAIELLNKTKEIDAEIGFRDKSLNYQLLFESANENEFKNSIKILESNNTNKFEDIAKIIFPKLKKIKEAQMELETASSEMQKRYDFFIPKE